MTANTSPLTTYWKGLPAELKAKLRLGFTGKRHLLDVAGWCFRSGDPALHPIAINALQVAFSENPLDGEMANELLSHDQIRAMLPDETESAFQAVAANWHKPESNAYFLRLLEKRDFVKIKNFIEQAATKEPANIYWREQAVGFGLMDNGIAWTRSMLEFEVPAGLAPSMANLTARLDRLEGKCHEAARLVQAIGSAFGEGYPAMKSGLCMLQGGDPAAANFMLIEALTRAPWNISLLMRVHDLLAGVDDSREALHGNTAILLYSWNKAIELDATLRSLIESDLAGASIFVLNNGSTDETASVLDSWQTRFDSTLGPDRFSVITLPVNIGAPAARNWLMHLESVQQHDFICYLDDDVILPSDWLQKLGSAVRHYPDAGVWGCKVVDHVNPGFIQSADSHLLIDVNPAPVDLGNVAPNPFKLSDLHIQSLDAGLFDFMRPCASVTGCCHLFRTEKLLKSGDFAIHLSPSQYDDWEHDLRLCKSGDFAVYQGHLSIRHKKRTGSASRTSMKEQGSALGNKYKMQTMHEPQEIVEAMEAEQALLEQDVLRKIRVIERVITE